MLGTGSGGLLDAEGSQGRLAAWSFLCLCPGEAGADRERTFRIRCIRAVPAGLIEQPAVSGDTQGAGRRHADRWLMVGSGSPTRAAERRRVGNCILPSFRGEVGLKQWTSQLRVMTLCIPIRACSIPLTGSEAKQNRT